MKQDILNNFIIQEIYKKYQIRYSISLPRIQKIIYIGNKDAWAYFKAEDLYNKRYVFYVNSKLLNNSKQFIKQILFHEFTHLADSLLFTDKTLKEFMYLMTSYSEFHASMREMIERIEQTNEKNISLQTRVTYMITSTIEDEIKLAFEIMIKDLHKMYTSKWSTDFYFDTKSIYYFFGYVSALKKFGINFPIRITDFIQGFMPELTAIYTSFSNKNIIPDEVMLRYSQLENAVVKKAIANDQII